MFHADPRLCCTGAPQSTSILLRGYKEVVRENDRKNCEQGVQDRKGHFVFTGLAMIFSMLQKKYRKSLPA